MFTRHRDTASRRIFTITFNRPNAVKYLLHLTKYVFSTVHSFDSKHSRHYILKNRITKCLRIIRPHSFATTWKQRRTSFLYSSPDVRKPGRIISRNSNGNGSSFAVHREGIRRFFNRSLLRISDFFGQGRAVNRQEFELWNEYGAFRPELCAERKENINLSKVANRRVLPFSRLPSSPTECQPR